jgi:glycosyltransferase involved in cell wall biosynthesis
VRVLHVTQAVGGGVSRHLADLVRATAGAGGGAGGEASIEHHVAVPPPWEGHISSGATYDRQALEVMEASGAIVHHVAMSRNPLSPANPLAVLGVRSLIRSLKPDVVHGHSAFGGAIARLAAAGMGVPTVFSPHCPRPGAATTASERALGRLTTRLVAVSASEAAEVLRRRFVPAERVVVVPNGIDPEPLGGPPFNARARLGLAPETPLIGSVGRLAAQKAPEALVAAFAAVRRRRPDAHFLLVGSGPLKRRVERAVRHSDLGGSWHYLEELPAAAGLLGELDVFVSASRKEGGPYTPLEAMRAGTPVVLSDVVGHRDCVEPGISGILTPYGDAEAMAAAIVRLLDDAELRTSIIDAARRQIAERFDLARMGAAYVELYRELVVGSSVEPSDPRRRPTKATHEGDTGELQDQPGSASFGDRR